jgi:hypothetical protein
MTEANNTETQPSAEIIPFPLRRTQSWRFIAEEYARRPDNGRYDKTSYADKVVNANAERLQRLGVSQARIDAEIASLQALFYRDNTEKVRA